MKLNNQGFAITGILYTLFILFLLILLSVLGSVSLKRNMLQQSISSQEDSFEGTLLSTNQLTEIVNSNITTVSGKYVFSIEGIDTKCFAYLKRGITLDDESITYTPSDCNDYEQTLTLEEVYSFERE